MKKNLQNAMAKNFQKMVNEQPAQDTSSKELSNIEASTESNDELEEKEDVSEPITPAIIEEAEPEAVIQPTKTNISSSVQANAQQNVQNTPVPTVQQPIIQQVPQPAMVNIPEQPATVQYVQPQVQVQQPVPVQQMVQTPIFNSENYATPVMNIPYTEPQINQQMNLQPKEKPAQGRSLNKKAIPLMPDEKSSGVLHIRLGELRSYVDFMTQSTKMSYQQYISNLIEQDYEKNKDLYLKYKSFMEQLNM